MFNKLWLKYEKSIIKDEKDEKIARAMKYVKLSGADVKHRIMARILEELELATGEMFGEPIQNCTGRGEFSGLLLELTEEGSFLSDSGVCEESLGEEGFYLARTEGTDGEWTYRVKASGYKGLLYGVFHLLGLLRQGKGGDVSQIVKRPSNPLRMMNHWDNMDGSIERGYSGRSFFFENNEMIIDERTGLYARAMASVGINGVVINNVNVKDAATYLISPSYYEKVRALSELFAGYGISLFLSVNYAMPLECGVDTADPLDNKVQDWWADKCREIYENVPLLGGFLVKADSEGRPGPFTYGRNQADGANMLAKAIAPYGGLIIWRCFVYNCQQDWRDRKTDRARAGYDYFKGLDGSFADNVILQIKNGPMDFQVREPVSPLFGGLEKTNQMLEVQIAQEYTGQQVHVCYLIPWFKEILAFQTGLKDADVSDLVSGRTFGRINCGMSAVCNTGNDYNWTGHDLAGANLYGFGRLAFDTTLSAEEIATEWIRLFYIGQIGKAGYEEKNGAKVEETVLSILMRSWPVYESYTSPLGIGWMVVPHYHYGPDVDGYEYSRWGTYHRADLHGIGVDRTTKGTGFTTQYNEPNASMYEKPETTPEELLLFFHHMPYTYRLQSGKTIIQHIYDTHFEGAEAAEEMLKDWKTLEGLIPESKYERGLARLTEQARHSKEWRDVINSYFWRKSGIPDEHGRELY